MKNDRPSGFLYVPAACLVALPCLAYSHPPVSLGTNKPALYFLPEGDNGADLPESGFSPEYRLSAYTMAASGSQSLSPAMALSAKPASSGAGGWYGPRRKL